MLSWKRQCSRLLLLPIWTLSAGLINEHLAAVLSPCDGNKFTAVHLPLIRLCFGELDMLKDHLELVVRLEWLARWLYTVESSVVSTMLAWCIAWDSTVRELDTFQGHLELVVKLEWLAGSTRPCSMCYRCVWRGVQLFWHNTCKSGGSL